MLRRRDHGDSAAVDAMAVAAVIDRRHQVAVRIVAGAQHVTELVQHHGGEVARAEAVGDHIDEAAAAAAHGHGERRALARSRMAAVDLGHDPGAGPADLRQGLVGRIGWQQAGAKTHEAVQHMVPLLQREANAFAFGGTEIAIDIDGERADAGRDGGGRRLVGIAIGGSIRNHAARGRSPPGRA